MQMAKLLHNGKYTYDSNASFNCSLFKLLKLLSLRFNNILAIQMTTDIKSEDLFVFLSAPDVFF